MTPFVGFAFLCGTLLALLALVACAAWHDRVVARRASERVQEQSRSLRYLVAVFEESPDAITAKDLHGCYVLVNRAAGQLLGRSPAELLGRDDHALYAPAQAEALRATEQRLMATGLTQQLDEERHTPAGRRTIRLTRGALRDGAGRLIGTYTIARDLHPPRAVSRPGMHEVSQAQAAAG